MKETFEVISEILNSSDSREEKVRKLQNLKNELVRILASESEGLTRSGAVGSKAGVYLEGVNAAIRKTEKK